MHPLLARQLNQAGIDPQAMSPQLADLVGQVEAAYQQADKRGAGLSRASAAGDRKNDDPYPVAVRAARVLLVGGNETDQMEISEILTGAGFACDIASDARRAVGAAGRESYDAVVVDCQTADIDGISPVAAIRAATTRSGRLPIVSMGAAGADQFLFKPTDPCALVDVLNQMLAPPEAQTPEPAPAVPPMDLDALLVRCMGDVDFRRRLLEMFPAQFNGCMTKIVDAVRTGDAQQTARAAHGLKGAAANLSATAVQRLAGRIELLGTEGAVADARKLIDELQAEVDRCLNFVGRSHPAIVD